MILPSCKTVTLLPLPPAPPLPPMTAVRVTECEVSESGEDVVEVLAPPRPPPRPPLGKNAMRGVANRGNRPLVHHGDNVPRAAAATRATQSEIEFDGGVAATAAGVRGAEAAGTAAAAHTLGQDGDGIGPARIVLPRSVTTTTPPLPALAIAAGADGNAEAPAVVVGSRAAGVGKGHAQRSIHDLGLAAVAATAAHALGQDAVGTVAQAVLMVAALVTTTLLALAPPPPWPPMADALRRRSARWPTTSHAEPAGATSAADALGEDAVRLSCRTC